MKKFILFLLLIFFLSACDDGETQVDPIALDSTALYGTAVSQATIDFEKTDAMVPTQTLAPVQTWTAIPTLDRTRPVFQTPTAETVCNMAAAGHPIDVTIPDGTVMAPGESFSKIWRLENVGRCTWTRLYAVVFFSGNSMEAIQNHYLLGEVEPGETIDVAVDMKAPSTPGLYQSNWMLVDPQGELYGIGPNGDAPFWVQIEVVAAITDTPEHTPTVTSTPLVYLSGQVVMVDQDQMDLDSGVVNPEDAAQIDFTYQHGGDPLHIIMTMNGTEWVEFDESEPAFDDCVSSEFSGDAISFEEVPAGTYLCYQTSDGLTGWMLFDNFEDGQLTISFLTWAAAEE